MNANSEYITHLSYIVYMTRGWPGHLPCVNKDGTVATSFVIVSASTYMYLTYSVRYKSFDMVKSKLQTYTLRKSHNWKQIWKRTAQWQKIFFLHI